LNMAPATTVSLFLDPGGKTTLGKIVEGFHQYFGLYLRSIISGGFNRSMI
jgi:hypothetical protein